MKKCTLCKRKFRTNRGVAMHKTFAHTNKRNVSGRNNPNFGKKGSNQFTNIDWDKVPWKKLSFAKKRQRVLKEANYACSQCGFNKRRVGGNIILHLDHIDGNNKNNARKNLRILCPNCHSLTPKYKNWKVIT